jgi:hypothetical protein
MGDYVNSLRSGLGRTKACVGYPLPKDLLSLQPDRKAILAHYRETGQAPPGTQITNKRPPVRVWKSA